MQTPLDEFLAYELNDYIRAELLEAIAGAESGRRYFTYDTFNVLLDIGAVTATVEDELDVTRQSVLPLDEFQALLHANGSS